MDTAEKKQDNVTFEDIRPYDEVKIEEHAARCGGKRNLREIPIETEDGYRFFYLVKKPGRAAMQAIAKYEQKKDIDNTQKIMLGCVLEGDKEAYEHDGAIYSQLLTNIGKLANTAKSSIKKL